MTERDLDDGDFDAIVASIDKSKAARNMVAFVTARSDDGEGEEASIVDTNNPLGLYSHGSSATTISGAVIALVGNSSDDSAIELVDLRSIDLEAEIKSTESDCT